MNKRKIIVASRKSLLAITQTGQAIALLEKANPDCVFEISPFTSTGDRVTDRPLSQMGGQGVFVKELETALSSGAADIAIHSLKDVPSAQPANLVLAGFPMRENPFDVLLCRDNGVLTTLKRGATLGTSSPRRLIQLKAARPDLVFADLRGNLDTRIRKLSEGQYDAILVAAAGMARLGISFREDQILSGDVCIPAIGQGSLAIECRRDDIKAVAIARSINHAPTEQAVLAERAFMREIGAGCSAPVAAFARMVESGMSMAAMIGDLDSGKIARMEISGRPEEYEALGIALARRMLIKCKQEGIRV